MNTIKCWALSLVAVLLLPNLAASADAAKEALENGKSFLEKKDYDSAIAAYTEAIRLDSENVEAYCNRGGAYAWKKEYDRAIADYTQAIKLDPKHAKAYHSRGNAYVFKGDHDKAITD